MAVGMAYLLVVAGIDTTWSALGTALWHLGTHPDDLARLVAEPALIPAAVEEFLRLYAPVSVGRIAAAETSSGGCPVKPGDRVRCRSGRPTATPTHFDRPDEFVVDRETNRHAAFGLGIHRCLGSNLARLELRVALEEWIRRLPPLPRRGPGRGHLDPRPRARTARRRRRDRSRTTETRRPSARTPPFLLGVDGVTELILVRHAKQAQPTTSSARPSGELHDPPLAESANARPRR